MISQLDTARRIEVGRLGGLVFPSGYFAYVGSALGGIEGRLRRHLGPVPLRRRWHIDYLMALARPLGAVWGSAQEGRECPLAAFLALTFRGFPGFGATDCRCPGHLFHARHLDELVAAARGAFGHLGREAQGWWSTDIPRHPGLGGRRSPHSSLSSRSADCRKPCAQGIHDALDD